MAMRACIGVEVGIGTVALKACLQSLSSLARLAVAAYPAG
jgi:hypothetical protein